MKEVEEREAWRKLRASHATSVDLSRTIEVSPDQVLHLNERCVVLAGFNGAGKSVTLQRVSAAIGDVGVVIRLHEVCEGIRSVLRSRTDISEMESEVGSLVIDDNLKASLARVVGREYSSIDWFDLELEPAEGLLEWPARGDHSLIPHFRVQHDGISYGSLEMGLGEFSVHVLLWVLHQYQEIPGAVLLLDEPDAYLPPATRRRLLALLLSLAEQNEWQIVLSSHSQELIGEAFENDSLVVLTRNEGLVQVLSASEHGYPVVRSLLGRPAIEAVLFCEDESAAALARAAIAAIRPELAESTEVLWNSGDGYMRKLSQHLPRRDGSPIRFAFVMDGDMRGSRVAPASKRRWDTVFLPTAESPDILFRSMRSDRHVLAEALRCDVPALSVTLDALEGSDEHDWVSNLCVAFGSRVDSLNALAALWVSQNLDLAREFVISLEIN